MSRFHEAMNSVLVSINARAEQEWQDYLATLSPEEKRRAVLKAQRDDCWVVPGSNGPLFGIAAGGALGGCTPSPKQNYTVLGFGDGSAPVLESMGRISLEEAERRGLVVNDLEV